MYELLTNAKVEVQSVISESGHTLAHITVNDQFEHTFPQSSRISKALDHTNNTESLRVSLNQLNNRLNNGQYFFIKDQLIDFRDSYYTGFVHDTTSIDKMMELIGYQDIVRTIKSGLNLTTSGESYMLVNKFSAENFEVPGYIQGGKFASNILFSWNPFVSFIKGAFEIVREICSNGAVGTSELINTRIPIINRWEEHMAIANNQMQRQVQQLSNTRLADMSNERAIVKDLQSIAHHSALRKATATDQLEKERLTKIGQVADPVLHLSSYYNPDVFADNNLSAQVVGHLTNFDLYNLATEMLTHTNENDDSSTTALQRMANRLLFPNSNLLKTGLNKQPMLSAFSDPDIAFFGA